MSSGPAAAPAHRRGPAVADRVLETTLTLLTARGYDFTVDDVARAAGVHKTTIYRRWETKPVLVAAAMQRLADRDVVPDTTGDPLADLDRLAVQVARALRQPAGANALRAALSTAGADADLRVTAAAFLADRYVVATGLIRTAQERGVIAPDHDPVLIWQAIVNPLHLNAALDGPLDDDTAHALVRIVLDGASTAAARPRRL